MSSKIESLTPAQEAQLDVYRDKWLAIGLSTDRVDPVRARPAVELLYRCGGLEPPENITFVKGPYEAKAALKALGVDDSIVSSCVFGSHEAGWLSFFDFFEHEVGIDLEHKLDGLYAVAKECGWVTVYDEAAIVQDRPLHIKMDDQNRLHCEDGPAILYADGFDVYSWHGVRVPEEWIKDKKSLTAKTAITWENTEQRRAACEILGWINVLKELNSRVIDEDADEQVGTLLEVEIPDIGTERFLRVTCGTGRQFAIPVPPDMETALAANAWTFNIEPDVLRMLEVRT